MITGAQIAEILSLYKKHGWTLSRVLLSGEMTKELSGEIENLFGAAKICSSEVSAAWFTRLSKNDDEAWELRVFDASPFALIEVFGAEDDEDFKAEKMREAENRLIEKFK